MYMYLNKVLLLRLDVSCVYEGSYRVVSGWKRSWGLFSMLSCLLILSSCRFVMSACLLVLSSYRFVMLSCLIVVLSSQGCHQEPRAADFPRLLREWPPATFIGNTRKTGPKEIPSHLIPCLLVVFTRQLEILVTTLLVYLFCHLADLLFHLSTCCVVLSNCCIVLSTCSFNLPIYHVVLSNCCVILIVY